MVRYLVAGLIVLTIAVFVIGYAGLLPVGNDGDRAVLNGDREAGSGDPAVELGQSIYQQQCANCHAIDDSGSVGPSFAGLYGSEVTMEDGSTVVADEDYLSESITDPNARVREGYPEIMPSFSSLDDEEIDGLIAFIRSLE